MEQYKIAFRGLNDGVYSYNLLIGKAFIDAFEIENIEDSIVNVAIEMVKREQMLELQITGKGTITVPCDRCLDLFPLEISFSNTLIVKTDAAKADVIDDNLIHLTEKDEYLDLLQYLYESLLLSIPIKKVHPEVKKGESGCNKAMLDILKPNKSKSHKNKDADPRWDAIKNIKF